MQLIVPVMAALVSVTVWTLTDAAAMAEGQIADRGYSNKIVWCGWRAEFLDRNPWCRGIGLARDLHVHVFEHVVAELVPLLVDQVARAISGMDTCEAVGLNVEVWPCRAVA